MSSTSPSPPKTNRTRPQKTNLALLITVAVLSVIILVLVALLVYYGYNLKQTVERDGMRIHVGIWSVFAPELLCRVIATPCAGPNKNSPYGRVLWPFLGDTPFALLNQSPEQQAAHAVGAHAMSYNSGILIFGEMPVNRVYHSWTGYCYDIPSTTNKNQRFVVAASVGDSIDNGNTKATVPNEYLAIICTPNPNMVTAIRNTFYDRFPYSGWPIQWQTIIIPSNMYDYNYRYCFFSRVLQTEFNDTIPPWQCFWFEAQPGLVPPPTLPVVANIKERSTTPNELLTFYPGISGTGEVSLWYAYTSNEIQEQFGPYIQNTNLTFQYAQRTIPYLSWVPGICPDPQGPACGMNCGCTAISTLQNFRFDNRSTIYYVCTEIQVPLGYKIAVLALDHVASTAVTAYSNITFTDMTNEVSWAGFITGIWDPLNPDTPTNPYTSPSWKPVGICESVPSHLFQNGVARVAVTERAYLNPNGVGPWYSAIAPAQVFLIPESAPCPSNWLTNVNTYAFPV